MKKAEIIAIIPARGGSKGVPRKNLRPVAGYPLIAYSIQAARLCAKIDRVIVSTDDEEIAQVARKYGAEVPFLRPAKYATDTAGDLDVMMHFLNWLRENGQSDPRYLIHLRPTTPLRDPELLTRVIDQIQSHPQATCLRSVHEMSETAYKCLELRPDGRLCQVFSRLPSIESANAPRQQFPKTYSPNGYADILVPQYLREAQQMHGDRGVGFMTAPAIEIDTIEAFQQLEYEVTKNPLFLERLFPHGSVSV